MATKTWSGSGNASVDANWSGGTKPVAGDDIVFDATSVADCTWDLTGVASNNFTIAATYSGTITFSATHTVNLSFTMNAGTVTQSSAITIGRNMAIAGGTFNQGANISVSVSGAYAFTLSGGTFTGNVSYTLTCAGNFTHTAGTLTTAVVRLIMTGSSKTITMSSGGGAFYDLTVNGDTAFVSGLAMNIITRNITVASGKTLTLSNTILRWQSYNSGTFSNSGIIAGTGILEIYQFTAGPTITFGTVNTPVTIRLDVGAADDRTATLGANATLGSSLTIVSNHATNTMTLATSTYTLSCTTLTIDTRGCLRQTGTNGNVTCTGYVQSGASSVLTGKTDATFTCNGNFTKSNGIITIFTLRLIMPVDGSVINISNTDASLYNLTCNGNVEYINSFSETNFVGNIINVASGKTLTLTNSLVIQTNSAGNNAIANSGTITIASGKNLYVKNHLDVNAIIVGNITGAGTLHFDLYDNTTAVNRVVTLGGNTSVSCNVKAENTWGTTYTITLATSTYTLTCAGITLSTYGCLTQSGTAGNISCTSYTQSGTSSVLTGKVDATFTCSADASITSGTATFGPATIGGACTVNGATAVLTQVATSTLSISGILTLTLGTITQSGDISVGSYSQAGGTLTGSALRWFYCSAGWSKTGGTLTAHALNIEMTGIGTFSDSGTDDILRTLKVTGTVTVGTGCYIGFLDVMDNGNLIIPSGKMIRVALTHSVNASYRFYNAGMVSGSGTLAIFAYLSNYNLNLGTVLCNLTITTGYSLAADVSITLTGVCTCKTINIKSNDTDNTITLLTGGYDISTGGITVDTRGILSCGASTINVCGTIDTSAGTLTEGTSTFVQCGTGNIKLAAGHKFYNFITTADSTLTANCTISRYYVYVKPIAVGAFTLTLTDATLTRGAWVIYPVVKPKIDPVIKSPYNVVLRYTQA